MQKKNFANFNKDTVKILVCCHKQCALPFDPDEIFLPIQVGAAISDTNLGVQRDDQLNGQPCDNISEKNKSYCELTAMYWAWKNIKKIYPDLEYIGLNHYRRYFDFGTKKNVRIVYQKNDFIEKINTKKLFSLLDTNEWILPKRRIVRGTLKTDYCEEHYSEDYRLAKQTISELYPEYTNAFDEYFSRGKKLYHYNMFIMPVADFFAYCQWLFDVLGYVEQRSIYSHYNDYQQRIFGFLAERLFTVYACREAKRIKEVPIIFLNDSIEKKYEKDGFINKLLYLKSRLMEHLNKKH